MAEICGQKYSASPPSGDGTKKCLRTHKIISIACFDVNPKTGRPYGSCVVCVPKNRSQQNKYSSTSIGKSKRKVQNDKQCNKEKKVIYRNSEIGKKKAKERTDTDAFRLQCSTYSKTEAGKAVSKKSYKKHKLSHNLMDAVGRVLKGANSALVCFHTSFDEVSLRAHFQHAEGHHGKDWTVEHYIPRSAYDHDDPEDVKRCWSPANMHPMKPRQNKEKSTKILPEYVSQVPVEFYPKSWEGVARTA
tara:strand:+ start:170 stop:907 length:738 start_codon:yes stop_codon:yes gene_type:complete